MIYGFLTRQQIHVILPTALFVGAERLVLHHSVSKADLLQLSKQGQLDEELAVCITMLEQAKRVNNLASFYLDQLSK